jgi:hypothetical protein
MLKLYQNTHIRNLAYYTTCNIQVSSFFHIPQSKAKGVEGYLKDIKTKAKHRILSQMFHKSYFIAPDCSLQGLLPKILSFKQLSHIPSGKQIYPNPISGGILQTQNV